MGEPRLLIEGKRTIGVTVAPANAGVVLVVVGVVDGATAEKDDGDDDDKNEWDGNGDVNNFDWCI